MAVTLVINGQSTPATPGRSLFDCAEGLGIQVPTSCQKQGKCKECMVEVSSGMELLTAPTLEEQHLKGSFRLACRCQVASDTGEVHCHTLRRGQMRIERHAIALPVSHKSAPLDPAVTRCGDSIRIDGVEIARSSGHIYGIAMDLGTTTVVLRLIDLETGELVADASLENPQRFGGSDVMSRIQYDTQHGGRLLARTLSGYLTHAIEAFPVRPESIYEVVIVGNTAMRDIFFHLDAYPIGQSPYRSTTEIDLEEGRRTTTSVTQTARRAQLPINSAARVYGGPIVSGHVGADASACMLAIDLAQEDRLVAIMDIGTNTELIVGNRHRILAASCPAGPAFEGGAITCGMPALDGAIEHIEISETGEFRSRVIGDVSPCGICGSGLVNLASELLRTGRMNELGRFEDEQSHITIDKSAGITFSEADINELAQAKGANVAGLHTVLNRYGVQFDDIEVFYLAGGFGRHLNLSAARRIGLIPNLPDAKFVQIGNAAIEGATIALLSRAKRQELELLVRRVEHCRLETHPQFFDFFVEGCQFKPVQSLHEMAG